MKHKQLGNIFKMFITKSCLGIVIDFSFFSPEQNQMSMINCFSHNSQAAGQENPHGFASAYA